MISYLLEGHRMLKRRLSVGRKGWTRYRGNAKEICTKIINDCWNGRYFQVSTGHFCQFYIRDFAYCVQALVNLGHRDKVIKTLEYALSVYSRYGRLATTITPNDKPLDVYHYSPESLALILYSIHVSGNKELIDQNIELILKEIAKVSTIIDDEGLLIKNIAFSSAKDNASRSSSCYNNSMLGLLKRELDFFKLPNPLKADYEKLLKKHFWTGEYFLDDLSGEDYVASDANIYPFWCGVIKNKTMLKKSIKAVQSVGLDEPWPIKYTAGRVKDDHKWFEIFVPNYEGNAVWMHHGPLYVELVRTINKKKSKEYFEKYRKLIETNQNYLEVFNPDGTVYKTPFYHADEGMIWCAKWLEMERSLA